MRWYMPVVALGITACSTPGIVDTGRVVIVASDSLLVGTLDNYN